MGAKSSIEWTDATWNPIRGCSMAKGSEAGGCLNCYAARFAIRNLPELKSPTTGEPFAILRPSGPRWTGEVELIESMLEVPLHWRKPKRVFVNSMSDLFHEALPDEAIDRVFDVIQKCPRQTFQILTKRELRAREYLLSRDWKLPNVWVGMSIEDQLNADAGREAMSAIAAAGWLTFVSYEPALDHVNWAGWEFLRWVIIGGESGPDARPFNLRWAYSSLKWFGDRDIARFMKQLGRRPGMPSCADMKCTHPDCGVDWLELRDAKGGDMAEWPKSLRVREYPA